MADVVSDDLNYEIWAPIMKATLVEKELWDVVENGIPPDPSKISATIEAEQLSKWRDLVVKDIKALQIIQSSLTDSAFKTTLIASSAKDVWDLLEKSNVQAKLCPRLEPDHLILTMTSINYTYDENMWMIYSAATNHMTPYAKFFTTLDTTYKARVGLAGGSITVAQGIGNVMIMTNKGNKKMIENVLFVPEINRNVLSVVQMGSLGYSVTIGGDKCIVKDQNMRVFGQTMKEERGFALRLRVIEGYLDH